MEKTNWIEKIKEAVYVAMNKGLNIEGYTPNFYDGAPYGFSIYTNSNEGIQITIYNDHITIITPKGHKSIDYKMTDRENLEIQAMFLSIKEYSEDMAISEFEEFISGKKEDPELTINDLDNEDD